MERDDAMRFAHEAMKRGYVGAPLWYLGERIVIDGNFFPKELEAIAWCMRNNEWPVE